MKQSSQPAPRVYSYIRYSTPEQKLGDSERRQIQNAKAYAEKHGYEFDEEIRDEGRSAFYGAHRKKGSLGRFLESVKAGKVPPGSILFVEEEDRLSREEMIDALGLVLDGLIRHDITVATPDAEYNRANLNSGGGIWRLVGKLQNAHDESRKKSDRLGKTWAEKKRRARGGKVATSRGPHWLRVEKADKDKFVQIPEAVETVRMIFALFPTLGRSRLIKKLNAEAPWKPQGRKRGTEGNGWRMSYVRKILSNRAVLGEYQPYTKRRGGKRVPDGEPIPDYFPRIIEPSVFHAVQERIQLNRGKGGRTGAALNLFSNLAKCAYCGGPMVHRNRGPLPKGGQYLVCDNAQRGVKCVRHIVRYAEIQDVVLNDCHRLQPERVLPDSNESAQRCDVLRTRIAGAEAEQRDNEQQIGNLMDQIARTSDPKMRDRYEQRVAVFDARNAELEAQRKADGEALRREAQSKESFTNWQQGIAALKSAIAPREAIDVRLKLQAHLKEFIEKIEVFSDGFAEIYDARVHGRADEHRTDGIVQELTAGAEEADPEWARSKQFRSFVGWVLKRRMSKEGRFYRVRFRTGQFVDLVPQGSLATEWRPVRRGEGKEWRFAGPDLSSLWTEFMATTQPSSSDASAGSKRSVV